METTTNLLNYHAAHAPEVPTWFKPDMRKKPKELELMRYTFGEASKHPKKNEFEAYWDYEENDWKITNEIGPSGLLVEEVTTHKSAIKQNEIDIKQWNTDFQFETIIQWRFSYAARMIDCFEALYKNYEKSL